MRLERVRRAAIGVFALVLVVANAIVVVTPASVHVAAENEGLRALDEVFLTGHMFAVDLALATDVLVEGRTRDGSWIPLAHDELFALDVPGDRVARLFATRARFLGGAPAQRAAWSDVAERMIHRHNRLHPDREIDAVRFGVEQWPLDPAGYEAQRTPERVTRTPWYGRALR